MPFEGQSDFESFFGPTSRVRVVSITTSPFGRMPKNLFSGTFAKSRTRCIAELWSAEKSAVASRNARYSCGGSVYMGKRNEEQESNLRLRLCRHGELPLLYPSVRSMSEALRWSTPFLERVGESTFIHFAVVRLRGAGTLVLNSRATCLPRIHGLLQFGDLGTS